MMKEDGTLEKTISTRKPLPSDEKYFKKLRDCKEITEFVSFTINNTSLITYKNKVVGFLNLLLLEEEPIQYEIQIAIFPQYQGLGIAKNTIYLLEKNLFSRPEVESICMNIDFKNEKSISLAEILGYFSLNEDNRIIEFIKYNPIYEKEKKK